MRTLEDIHINEGKLFQTTDFGFSFIKGEEKDGKHIIYLEASNESKDQEGEIVIMKALKNAAEDYCSKGVISWDHQHQIKNDPEFIIGEPLDVKFTNNNSTIVKGMLYKQNPKANSVWNNIQSGSTRFGASIGGSILNKADNIINAVIWRDLAITHKPVNDTTFGHVQMIPFTEFAKALMAGAGVNAGAYTGGRALTGENLQDHVVDGTFGQTDIIKNLPYEESRNFFDNVLVMIKHEKIMSMNDVISYTLDQGYDRGVASTLIQFIAKKLPYLRERRSSMDKADDKVLDLEDLEKSWNDSKDTVRALLGEDLTKSETDTEENVSGEKEESLQKAKDDELDFEEEDEDKDDEEEEKEDTKEADGIKKSLEDDMSADSESEVAMDVEPFLRTLVKSISDKFDSINVAIAEMSEQTSALIKSSDETNELQKASAKMFVDYGEMQKSMSETVEAIGNTAQKSTSKLRKSNTRFNIGDDQGKVVTRQEILQKATKWREEGKLQLRDVTKLENRLNKGMPLPENVQKLLEEDK